MANFLTWATDVLEKVDQSAAHLSDSGGLDRTRQRRPKEGRGAGAEGGSLTDGQTSDYSGYGSDRPSDPPWASEQRGDAQISAVDGSGLLPPPSLLEAPSVTMKLAGAAVPGTTGPLGSGASSQPANGRAPQPWELPVGPSSALYAAKAPSLALENLRVVRRTMEGLVWQQDELKSEYEGTLRQTSEAEVKVSILVSEMEKLRKSAALAAALHEQERADLREEALALQAAHSKEEKAHSATRIQSQMRASSLAAENVAYAKALGSTQRHAEERAAEAARLEGRMEELAREKQRLSGELAQLRLKAEQQEAEGREGGPRGAVSEKVPISRERAEAGAAEQQSGRGGEVGGGGEEMGVGVGARAREARQKRVELASWDSQVAALEGELATLQQSAARWPSTGQREKEMERRLRGLNEQLLTKQAQAESLANERAALQLRLDRIQEARRQLQAGVDSYDVDLKRNKIGRSFSTSTSGAGSSPAVPDSSGSILDDPSGKNRPRSTARGVTEGIARMASTMDTLSLRAGAALQRHSSARSFIVAYVLGLHLAVFVILSWAAAQKALGG